MTKRPMSITFISWFLIITSGISIISTSMLYKNPEAIIMMELAAMSVPVQLGIFVVGVIIAISCGVLMLKGNNIGRITYVAYAIISQLTASFTSPVKVMLIPGAIVFIIIAIFLFRPKANEYFSSAPKEES